MGDNRDKAAEASAAAAADNADTVTHESWMASLPGGLDAFIGLDALASDNPSKKQAIRERDMALARCSVLMSCLDGLVGCYEVARGQLPPAAFDVLRAFMDSEVRAAKLALTATQSIDLRARVGRMVEEGWTQPPPAPNGTRPVWEAIVADLMPHASSPAAQAMLTDMRARDRIGRQRYGTPLQAHNGRDALWDLYAEQMDAVAYAWQNIEENPDNYVFRSVYHQHVQMALGTRRMLLVRDMAARMEADPATLIKSIVAGREPVALTLPDAPADDPDDGACAPADGEDCAGFEVEPGAYSGCTAAATGATDCPVCGDNDDRDEE